MKHQMATRLQFFLSLSRQNLLWLTIVLFLLVIRVCWHEQGSVPRMFRGRVYLTIVMELSREINTMIVILSLQNSSSVRRPGVCRPGMDVNLNIAILMAVLTSYMMQHQYSNGSRHRFRLVQTKQLWVRLVSNSGFTINESAK
jgi:hypothetical protein